MIQSLIKKWSVPGVIIEENRRVPGMWIRIYRFKLLWFQLNSWALKRVVAASPQTLPLTESRPSATFKKVTTDYLDQGPKILKKLHLLLPSPCSKWANSHRKISLPVTVKSQSESTRFQKTKACNLLDTKQVVTSMSMIKMQRTTLSTSSPSRRQCPKLKLKKWRPRQYPKSSLFLRRKTKRSQVRKIKLPSIQIPRGTLMLRCATSEEWLRRRSSLSCSKPQSLRTLQMPWMDRRWAWVTLVLLTPIPLISLSQQIIWVSRKKSLCHMESYLRILRMKTTRITLFQEYLSQRIDRWLD